MRCLLLLLVITFSYVLSAQIKTDTIYDRWGQLNQIRYSTKLDLAEKSKAYLFQRGIMAGQTVFELDSIRVFDKNGKSKMINDPLMLDPPKGVQGASAISIRSSTAKKAAAEKYRANSISTATDYVEGRAGMLVRRKIPKGENVKNIIRLDDSPEIELIENMEGGNGDLKAKVYIPAGATDRKLILDLGDGKRWEKLYTIRGYHLNETDFKRKDQLTEAQTWRAEGQDHLYLRLRSTEKLLYISQGETRYKPVPVGRQLDEVYLKGLATGKYLLEIIDLGTREKRYHWMVI